MVFYNRTTRVKKDKIDEIVEFFKHIPTIICGNKNEYEYIKGSKLYKYKNTHNKEHILFLLKVMKIT